MARPLRVVSVLPSATEMLCFIGGGHLLIGRSHEDNYPESITHLPVVTGQLTEFTTAGEVDKQVSAALSSGQSLYTIDEQLLTSLQPDVILTQDICAVCAIDLQTVQRLAARMSPQPQVISLNPLGLDDVLDNLLQVGEAVGMQREAQAARASLETRLCRADELVAASQAATAAQVQAAEPEPEPEPVAKGAAAVKGAADAEDAAAGAVATRPCVAFIEWPDPLYVGGHWTPQLIERAGGTHPLNPARPQGAAKSFAVTAEALLATAPRLTILAPCGLNLQQTRSEFGRMKALPWWPRLEESCGGRVALVDGDAMFNRPGPRLVDAYEWLVATIQALPHAAPADFPVEWVSNASTAAAAAAAAAAGGGGGGGGAAAATESAAERVQRLRAELAAAEAELAEEGLGAAAAIEDAHLCAVRQGHHSYTDPKTGGHPC